MKNQFKFDHTDVDNVLFNGKPPIVTIYPFNKSTIEALRLVSFTIVLNSLILDDHSLTNYLKLSKVVKGIKNTVVPEKELVDYFSSENISIVNLLFIEVMKAFVQWRDYFYAALPDYTETVTSRFQWEVITAIGVEHIIKPPFSSEQHLWVAYASTWNKAKEHKFIVDVAESLHPWMNIDMYKHLEKLKDTKHINVRFEEQKKEMLTGSFGLPQSDKTIIADLEKQQSEDLDIIK